MYDHIIQNEQVRVTVDILSTFALHKRDYEAAQSYEERQDIMLQYCEDMMQFIFSSKEGCWSPENVELVDYREGVFEVVSEDEDPPSSEDIKNMI